MDSVWRVISLQLMFCSVQAIYEYGEWLLTTNGKIALEKNQPIGIEQVRAIAVYTMLPRPVRIQIWRRQSEQNYTLDWEKRLLPHRDFPKFGLSTVNLDEDEIFTIENDHRLGIYSEQDPGPILYDVVGGARVVFSKLSYEFERFGEILQDKENVPFEDLEFPYKFSVELCNTTGCYTGITTEARTYFPQPQQKSTEQTEIIVRQVKEDGELLNEDFLLGVLIWLIIISFCVIAIILLLVCIYLRPRQQKETNGDEGDWYVVVDDPNYLQQLQGTGQQSST